MSSPANTSLFVLEEADQGLTIAAVLRKRLQISWSEAKNLCETGKVFVGKDRILDPAKRLKVGGVVEVRMNAKAPLSKEATKAVGAIMYEDAQLIVVNKPSGISSVPYERGETGTAMDLIREAWRAQNRPATSTPLYVVHRIDKDTSGLLMFAKTKSAEIFLQQLLRKHEIDRKYICVAHGKVIDQKIETYLIKDRGDGLRGSVKNPEGRPDARRAVTMVKALEYLHGATLCEVRLETGKTHQIRIHMAERGYPLVGETVYIRDYLNHGNEPIESSRLLLHAQTLGFPHPSTGETMQFSQDPPENFQQEVRHLRKG